MAGGLGAQSAASGPSGCPPLEVSACDKRAMFGPVSGGGVLGGGRASAPPLSIFVGCLAARCDAQVRVVAPPRGGRGACRRAPPRVDTRAVPKLSLGREG
eukprot:CAMPEP_0182873956 /NCGR_PEP_ID=MMETSP0034_2-20130328/12638_1 /TAXON_ID=156128 /ORGANISM="Nephroselmis pyriformis, Strain CCMP717" /LENGTH=99 /DNA_ID=CAMNT_0025006639 /DNA_START=183 /DNA_END=482 /DNA_ORIENTATION=-